MTTTIVRINARLDDVTGRKLAHLERATGWNVSEIVRRAIDAYYDRSKAAGADPAGVLKQAGFIGCASGPRDLASRYKQHLPRLADKHGHR